MWLSPNILGILNDILVYTAEIWFYMLLVGIPIRMLTTVITKGRIEFM